MMAGEKLLLFNGLIHTMESTPPEATAILIEGARIKAVGADRELLLLADAATRRINLEGRTVLPGLLDAHTHLGGFGLRAEQVNLDGAADLEEVRRRVAEGARRLPAGTWILGGGWNRNVWPGGDFPAAVDLDPVSPQNPVALSSKDGHALWLNSVALAQVASLLPAAGEDVAGGAILRNEKGQATGIFLEKAMDLVRQTIPRPGVDDYRRALKRAMQLANARGLTGVHVMEGPLTLAAFQDLLAAGEMTLRVGMYMPADKLVELADLGLRGGWGNNWLWLAGVKTFADGALGSNSAHLIEPYEGRPGYRGIAVQPRAELTELVRRAVAAGFAVALHAIGDQANRDALDAFAASAEESWRLGLRHRIEHAQLLHPDDIGRFAQLGVVASMQPIHCTSDRYMADRYWGRRCRYAYAWRSLLDSGARLAFGSDAPVETIDPWEGIYAAITRKRATEPASEPWYPEERISLLEALRAYTLGAAYAGGKDHLLGSLRPGKLADLVVLEKDIFHLPPEEILEPGLLATVVGGKVVFGSLW